jgi:hypothetical protein
MALDLQITQAIPAALAVQHSKDGTKLKAAADALKAAFDADIVKYGKEAVSAHQSFALADMLHTRLSTAAARLVRRVSDGML